jgi:hypothetical protein
MVGSWSEGRYFLHAWLRWARPCSSLLRKMGAAALLADALLGTIGRIAAAGVGHGLALMAAGLA